MADNALFDAQSVTDAVAEGISKIQNASSLEELKAIKTQYAGAESAMTKASKAIGSLPVDQKKEAGKLMGKLRADFGRAFGPKEAELKAQEEQRALEAETVDMTLPVNRRPLGARHPLAKLMEDVETCSSPWDGRSPPAPRWRPNGMTSTPELRPGSSRPPDAGHLLCQGQPGP